MKVIEEKTTLVQTSELRTKLDEILKQLSESHVILEKRHRPVAILVAPQEYQRMEESVEQLSDILLALEARAREKRKNRKYLTLEEARKRLGLL